MKKLILFILVVLVISCKDDDKNAGPGVCGYESIADTDWMASLRDSMTNCTCEKSIITGKYEGYTVFFVAVTDPLCNSVFAPTLYNCEGTAVKSFESTMEAQNEFYNKVTERNVVYRCTQ
jgi:hypothetical protein